MGSSFGALACHDWVCWNCWPAMSCQAHVRSDDYQEIHDRHVWRPFGCSDSQRHCSILQCFRPLPPRSWRSSLVQWQRKTSSISGCRHWKKPTLRPTRPERLRKYKKRGKKRRNQDTLNFKDLQMPLTLPQKCGLHTFQILPVASRGLARSKWNTCQNQNFEQTSGPAWPSSVQLMSKRCLAETPRCYRVLLGGLGILKPAGPLLVEDVLLHNFKEW